MGSHAFAGYMPQAINLQTEPSIPPNSTLYVNNLNEKLKKEELKRQLYMLFSAHGQILDIVASKTMRGRGQAFIVFKEMTSATFALRALQGFTFFDKPMRINYARTKSDAIAKLEDNLVEHRAHRLEERKRKRAEDASKPKTVKTVKAPVKVELTEEQMEDLLPPHKILFVKKLTKDATEPILTDLFSKHAGFLEVRTVPGKPDIAFVEYENDAYAAQARLALQGFEIIADHPMRIVFGKK